MKSIIGILTFFLLTSCASYKSSSIIGLYATKGGFEWGSSIQIDEDSTFTYVWQVGLLTGETAGKWRLYRNKLILNSYTQPQEDTTPNYFLLEANNTNSDIIRLNLVWFDNAEPLAGAFGVMYRNGDTLNAQISDLNGLMNFQKQTFDSIKISFIGLRDIIIDDKINDRFTIATVDSFEDAYEYFTNDIWKICGNYLIDRTRNKYYYEKRLKKIVK